MYSVTAHTEEIDDLLEAVGDIFEQTADFVFRNNSMAIVFVEEDTDYDELYSRLREKWDFPIIGCTAMATLMGQDGYCSTGISVLILSADDVTFSVGSTGELDKDNYIERISSTYNELKKAHSSDIKLILSYAGMVITEKHVAGDELLDALNQVSGDVPVYGATASDGFSFTRFHAYCNGETVTNGEVMALISGNIDPHFVCINSVENRASFSYEITKSKSNLVYRLGVGSFIDTLRKEDMEADKTDVLGDYILSPFIVKVQKGNGDSVEVARNLTSLNHETGAGNFLGIMPEGSMLSIGIINRNDVQKSVTDAFDHILKVISSPDNKFKTLLCTSCCARFLALASNTSAEAEAYLGRLPDDVSLAGLYAYGEYCPLKAEPSGRQYNMFHNFTFTVLAI